jgi:DNA-binding NarL/FixJ family response regulator
VFLIDDQAMIRAGLRSLLEQAGGFDVVGDASSAREGIRRVRELRPDVVILDITMPDLSGLDAVAPLKEASPSSKVLMASQHEGELFVREALRAGADGYVSKDSEPEELQLAIRSMLRGDSYLSPKVSAALVRSLFHGAPGAGGRTARADGTGSRTARADGTGAAGAPARGASPEGTGAAGPGSGAGAASAAAPSSASSASSTSTSSSSSSSAASSAASGAAPSAAGGCLGPLTPRERQVFLLVAQGRTNKEAAEALGLSLGTVKKHRENLQRKLGCHSAAELARLAIREGLIWP